MANNENEIQNSDRLGEKYQSVKDGQELAERQIEKANSFLSFFIRDKTAIKVREKMEKAALIELTQRVRAFSLHSEFNIQTLEEEYNNALALTKLDLRGKQAIKIMSSHNDIMLQLDEEGKKFIELIQKRQDEINNSDLPLIKENLEEVFKDDIEKFFKIRKTVFDRLRNLVHEFLEI